jgi:hypothetical protein
MASVQGFGKVRMNFSLHHMMAASRFAAKAGEIEDQHRGKPYGPFFDEIVVHVSSTIIMAAASLECFINEVFLMPDIYFSELDKGFREEMWELIEARRPLEKFQLATVLKKKPRMDKGGAVYQNADTLIRMRNALLHFKPEWSDEKDVHKTIEQRIRSKFPLSPFYQGDNTFPEKCMSYGCAEWSVKVALAFVEAFSTETGIENRYLKHLDKINTSVSPKLSG